MLNKIKAAISTIIDRAFSVVVKLVSVKGLVFFMATWLLLQDKIDDTTWWITAGIIIGGRALEKIKGK